MKKKKIVFLAEAGTIEPGLRIYDGLSQGWQLRSDHKDVQPCEGIADFEEQFDVEVITQNVDNLHVEYVPATSTIYVETPDLWDIEREASEGMKELYNLLYIETIAVDGAQTTENSSNIKNIS